MSPRQDSVFNWTFAAVAALIVALLPSVTHGAETERPLSVSEADFAFLQALEAEVANDLGSLGDGLAASGTIPGAGCGYVPSRRVTSGKTYSGQPVGGPLDLAADPEIHRRGSPERIDTSILRWSTDEDSRPHHAIPGGGWCTGSRCGLGVHGLGVPSAILSFYSNRSPAQRPVELRGINLACAPNMREAIDLIASGQGWPLITRWQADRGGAPPPLPPLKAIVSWSPTLPVIGEVASFTALKNQGTVTYDWKFAKAGDPSSIEYRSGREVSFAFPQEGLWILHLTVGRGQEVKSQIRQIHVQPAQDSLPCPEGKVCLAMWDPETQSHQDYEMVYVPPGRSTSSLELMWARPGAISASTAAGSPEELERGWRIPRSSPAPSRQERVFRVTAASPSFSIPLSDLGIGPGEPIEIEGTIALGPAPLAPRSPIVWLGHGEPKKEWESPCGLKLNGKNGRSLLETVMGPHGRRGGGGKRGWWAPGSRSDFTLSLSGGECRLDLVDGGRTDRVATAPKSSPRPSHLYIGIPAPMDRKRCPGGCWRTPIGAVISLRVPGGGAQPVPPPSGSPVRELLSRAAGAIGEALSILQGEKGER
ncbi:MAG: hypothetical protein K0U98_14975 [Deltaproteobacteria bacterium]|nr:hypothetical protein [Deltaproteobacteria bacterium]